jgi:capsular exopolysaccharide synthesis family protein
MSRTWEALKKADAERSHPARPLNLTMPIVRSAAVSPAAPDDAHLEYERIRVWLRHSADPSQRLQTLMVVACHSGAGGTTTASLLAVTLAEARSCRVLVIESNWRTPKLGSVFGLPGHHSENGHPFDLAALEARISASDRPNLFVLPAPDRNDSPQRPFEDDTLDELLAAAKLRFDLVIFDAAPVGLFPDSLALAAKVDGVILVTESERTRMDEARRAKDDLERAGARILGVVINRHTDYVPRFLRRALGSH